MASPDEWFNEKLLEYREGRLATGLLLDLGVALDFNVPGWMASKAIYMNQSILRKSVTKHGLDLASFMDLPSRIADPTLIFDSYTHPGAFVVVLDLILKSKPVALAVHPSEHRNLGTINDVRSIHLKDQVQIDWWVNQGLLRYQKKNEPSCLQDSATFS